MAEVDARPWHESKGLELGNWLQNKCPQRQFGGQAKVDGLVRTLTAAHERLVKAETNEERAVAWAHVALDLVAPCEGAGDFHKLWVTNLLKGTPSEPTSARDGDCQTDVPEFKDAAVLCELLEPPPPPPKATVLPPLDIPAASSVEPLLSKTERSRTPSAEAPRSQSAREEKKPNMLKMSMHERNEYIRKQKQAKLEEAREAKLAAEVAEMRAPKFNKPRRVAVVALAAEKLKKPLRERDANKKKEVSQKPAEKKKKKKRKAVAKPPKPEPEPAAPAPDEFMTRLAVLRQDAQAKIAAAAAEQAAALPPAAAARALIRTRCEFDRRLEGRCFVRLRHAEDCDPRQIYRRRAGNGEGVALSVGWDAMNAEHVLQVIFDEELWNETTAHDYLVQHYSVEYSKRLDAKA